MDFSYDKGDDNNVICIKIPLRIWYTAESDSIQSQDTLWKAWVSRDTLSEIYGILLPKLCWPTLRKNCPRDREKLLKFEAEGREFAKFLRSLEQFIQTVKG